MTELNELEYHPPIFAIIAISALIASLIVYLIFYFFKKWSLNPKDYPVGTTFVAFTNYYEHQCTDAFIDQYTVISWSDDGKYVKVNNVKNKYMKASAFSSISKVSKL